MEKSSSIQTRVNIGNPNSNNLYRIKCIEVSKPRRSSILNHLNRLVIIFIIIISFTFNNGLIASEPEPSIPKRGMYIPDGDLLIENIQNNGDDPNLSPYAVDLFSYCFNHNFSYVILYGMFDNYIDSQSQLEPLISNDLYVYAIRKFIEECHLRNIKVGIRVGNNYNNFTTSEFYFKENWWHCEMQESPIDPSDVNPESTDYEVVELSEILKQGLRIADFCYNAECEARNTCPNIEDQSTVESNQRFDYISVEYEYWNSATFGNFNNDPSPFTNSRTFKAWNQYKKISTALSVIRSQMCNTILIETELKLEKIPFEETPPNSPIPFFVNNCAEIDEQAEFIDNRYDRILLVSYNKNPERLFPHNDAGWFWFARTDRPNTEIWPLFHAGAEALYKHHVFGTTHGNGMYSDDYLGDFYLNGGTLADAEDVYHEAWSNAHISCNYECEYCNTNFISLPFPVDQCDYWMGDSNLGGFMYYDYFALFDASAIGGHEFGRFSAEKSENNGSDFQFSFFPNPTFNVLNIKTETDITKSLVVFQLIDVTGRIVLNQKIKNTLSHIDTGLITNGVYRGRISINGIEKESKPIVICR